MHAWGVTCEKTFLMAAGGGRPGTAAPVLGLPQCVRLLRTIGQDRHSWGLLGASLGSLALLGPLVPLGRFLAHGGPPIADPYPWQAVARPYPIHGPRNGPCCSPSLPHQNLASSASSQGAFFLLRKLIKCWWERGELQDGLQDGLWMSYMMEKLVI